MSYHDSSRNSNKKITNHCTPINLISRQNNRNTVRDKRSTVYTLTPYVRAGTTHANCRVVMGLQQSFANVSITANVLEQIKINHKHLLFLKYRSRAVHKSTVIARPRSSGKRTLVSWSRGKCTLVPFENNTHEHNDIFLAVTCFSFNLQTWFSTSVVILHIFRRPHVRGSRPSFVYTGIVPWRKKNREKVPSIIYNIYFLQISI